eukprot:814584-Rhodomonas_salina.1
MTVRTVRISLDETVSVPRASRSGPLHWQSPIPRHAVSSSVESLHLSPASHTTVTLPGPSQPEAPGPGPASFKFTALQQADPLRPGGHGGSTV